MRLSGGVERAVWHGILVAAMPAMCTAQQAAQGAGQNEKILLNGTWQFSLAKNEAVADQMGNFYQAGYDTSKFVPIKVPSNWALGGFETPHYKPFRGEA